MLRLCTSAHLTGQKHCGTCGALAKIPLKGEGSVLLPRHARRLTVAADNGRDSIAMLRRHQGVRAENQSPWVWPKRQPKPAPGPRGFADPTV